MIARVHERRGGSPWPPDGPGVSRPARPARPARRTSGCLRVPRPLRTDQDYAQYHHLDLAELSDRSLAQQHQRARIAYGLAESSDDGEWWLSRIAAVRAEIERRRRS